MATIKQDVMQFLNETIKNNQQKDFKEYITLLHNWTKMNGFTMNRKQAILLDSFRLNESQEFKDEYVKILNKYI